MGEKGSENREREDVRVGREKEGVRVGRKMG